MYRKLRHQQPVLLNRRDSILLHDNARSHVRTFHKSFNEHFALMLMLMLMLVPRDNLVSEYNCHKVPATNDGIAQFFSLSESKIAFCKLPLDDNQLDKTTCYIHFNEMVSVASLS